MIDAQLILSEMKLLREAIEALEERIPKRAKPKRKSNPSLEEVEEYAKAKGRSDLAKTFYDHYTVGYEKKKQWCNAGDKPIYNWKNTFSSWVNRDQSNTPTPNGRSLWNE